MKLTKIRCSETNKKLIHNRMKKLAEHLQNRLAYHGYKVFARVTNSSRIDMSYQGCSFRVNDLIHGYNAQYNPFRNTKNGYVRTTLPTWKQRVHFNEIVNTILTTWDISTNVHSGPYTLRLGTEEFNEENWLEQKPQYQIENEIRGFRIEDLEEDCA